MKATPEPLAEEIAAPDRKRPIGTTILSRGKRTFLASRIEAVIRLHPNVKDCAVVQRPDAKIWAIIAPVDESHLQLYRHFQRDMKIHFQRQREKVPTYMHPDMYSVIKALPITNKGAVDRAALATNRRFNSDDECVIPRIRRPLLTFTVEGVVWNRMWMNRNSCTGFVTLALYKDKAFEPLKIEVRCKPHLMPGFKVGLHVIVEGEIGKNNVLWCRSWQRKTDLRTRIPLDQTDKLLESLRG